MMSGDKNNIVMQWVVSLAISITCSAVMFVLFAGAMLDSQKMLVSLQVKQDWLEAKLYSTENNIVGLQRELMKLQVSNGAAAQAATRINDAPAQKLDKPVELPQAGLPADPVVPAAAPIAPAVPAPVPATTP